MSDLAATREHLRDERIWCVAARVVIIDGDDSHWAYSEEGHLTVSVLTLKHGVPIRAILKGGDNAGSGIWFIPSVGTEVILSFDDGDFEGDAYIVGVHGKAPTGITSDTVFVIGASVVIKKIGGIPNRLVTVDEFNELCSWIESDMQIGADTHGDTTPPGTSNSPPTANGTTVLRAE